VLARFAVSDRGAPAPPCRERTRKSELLASDHRASDLPYALPLKKLALEADGVIILWHYCVPR